MSDDIRNSVLLNTFYCGRKRYRLYYHRNQIVWDNERPPYAQHTVPMENVIAVEYVQLKGNPADEQLYDPNHFTIHYAEPKNENLWRYNSLTLKHADTMQVSSWVKTLQNHLQSFNRRPKRLLLFVNPYGGKRKALKIFESFGKPLFATAGIDVSVIVSQRQNQIRDIVIHHNLDMFDSVACVGGDGTVSELLNGLVMRECQLRGVDPNNPHQELPKPSIPVGIIPGGSTDTIAYCVHGTTDVTTAVLHIIFGDPLGLDLVSVRSNDRLLRLFASTVSYGYLGDVAYNSERLRWMGPIRYEYCGFKKIVANEGYKGEISILEGEPSEEETKCFENCQKCLKKQDDINNKKENSWKTIQGKFFMVSGANISCACERSPSGIAPYCHLGDGCLYLVVIRHTSLLNNLRILWRFSKNSYSTEDLSFVEIHRVKEFYFRAVDMHSRWNCDGEIVHESEIHAKVHCQLLTVFSRGSRIPEESNTKGCNICSI